MAIETSTTRSHGQDVTYHRSRGGDNVVVLIHGSGPGVSALSNWTRLIEALGPDFDVIAPDLLGFGGSPCSLELNGVVEWLPLWVEQIRDLLDELGIEQANVVGNSLGGGIALQLLAKFPERYQRAVLMGPVGVPFSVPPALARGWGFYQNPTPDAFGHLISEFVADSRRINLAPIISERWNAVTDPTLRRCYESMFAGDLQRHADGLVIPRHILAAVTHETLVIHGKEDRFVPWANAVALEEVMPNCQAHIFSDCGHWVQVDKWQAFFTLVGEFLTGVLQ